MNFPCTQIFFVCKKNIVDYYQYISDYNSLYKYYFTYFAEYTWVNYRNVLKIETTITFDQLDNKPGAIKRKRFESKSNRFFKLMRHSKSRPDTMNSLNACNVYLFGKIIVDPLKSYFCWNVTYTTYYILEITANKNTKIIILFQNILETTKN